MYNLNPNGFLCAISIIQITFGPIKIRKLEFILKTFNSAFNNLLLQYGCFLKLQLLLLLFPTHNNCLLFLLLTFLS